MNEIIPFKFGSKPIRVINDENGNPWFVAKDSAEILGYKDSNNAIKQHCRGVVKHHPIVDILGRTQNARIISEPDLYRLIAGSQLESSVKFEAWVFEEVIPSIRKKGSYQIKEPSRIELLQMCLDSEKKRIEAESTIEKNRPKMIAYQTMVESDGLLTLRASAKALGQPPNSFLRALRKAKVLYYLDKKNIPNQTYINRGYFVVKAKTRMVEILGDECAKTFSQTFVTPAGMDWLSREFLQKRLAA